jgi:hypothetical protein
VLVGKLAEILRDQRPTRKVAAMFIDMAFGAPIYERMRALGFNNVFEPNFGLVHTPDRTKANMRAYMWDKMKDWLLHGAIETDEKMAADLAGPGYHINRSNLLVLESKADMQKRGQRSPDDGDALGADLCAARGTGGSRRRGRGGRIREIQGQRQFGVDAMTSPGGCTLVPRSMGDRHGRGGLDGFVRTDLGCWTQGLFSPVTASQP